MGTLLGNVIKGRLQNYLEETGQVPHSMFCFRRHLCTQNVLLRLKKDIFKETTRNTHVSILALGLKVDYDNVLHCGILSTLNSTAWGVRAYNYIRSLIGRTAQIKISDLESDILQIGDKGTTQGAVLSPLPLRSPSSLPTAETTTQPKSQGRLLC